MISIIDYQMGNLRSVQKALEHLGESAQFVSDRSGVLGADKLILPGVGAFADAIAELRRRDLIGPIREVIERGTPFLGICLGLQLLFDVSYEDGEHQGLGILRGDVRRFELSAPCKVPHMGWNQVRVLQPCPLLHGIEDGAFFYFVHSYYVTPVDPSVVALQTDYGHPFCSMIARGSLFGTQFHPEKSQRDGLRLLANFAQLPGG
ncbi:MAG: imidazole glycerol phosphate synthase subunit HisH [Planctomycetes bacterium]|nr:imidazole glycerol phosphate synthase subunit HisH [Planctomycetota bacterium]